MYTSRFLQGNGRRTISSFWKSSTMRNASSKSQRYFSQSRFRYERNLNESFDFPYKGSGMSSMEKAGWTLAGTLSLVGIGTIAYQGTHSEIYSEQLFPGYVQDRVKSVYSHLLGGITITAGSAVAAYKMGAHKALMGMSPMVGLIGTTVVMIGSMILMTSMDYQNNRAQKYVAWTLFNGAMGLTLSRVGLFGGPLVMRAAAATGLLVGSLSMVAACSPSDKFLWMGGPLTIGLGVVVGASVGQLFFPAASMLNTISLYGGLGLFGAFVLYDTSRVVTVAKETPDGEFDPINTSLSIYLDSINLFIRILEVMARSSGSGSKRR